MANLTDKYNTKLSDSEEQQFQSWALQNGRTNDTMDYDMRGWWKENAKNGTPAPGQHFTDKYKKPNHPTFSDESIYHGKDGNKGGTWGGTDAAPTFKPSKTNLQNLTREQLQQYFQNVEPGVMLLLPPTKAQKRYGAQP